MRLNDVEFKWGKLNKKWELVQWESDQANFVIAFFERDEEGYEMHAVGDRFFQAGEDAWLVSKHAQSFLNALFERERRENDGII